MTRILLVTVGGSPEPIIHAVRSHAPDEVVFVCSAPPCPTPSLDQVIGEGSPCRHELPSPNDDASEAKQPAIEWRPNLVTQLGLMAFRRELQIVEIPDPDDLADVYKRLRGFCRTLRDRFSRLELLGDYSGGTKTMSAALALALVEEQAQLTAVMGKRTNLRRIDQSLGLTDMRISPLQAARSLRERLPLLLEDHRYDRLASALADFRRACGEDIEDGTLQALGHLERTLEVLVLWDRFRWDEATARVRSTPLPDAFPDLIAWWERVEASRRCFEEGKQLPDGVTGYELVQDLLLNAERRGRRGWYDDAVARLYRALELLAQTYIQLELEYDHQTFWDDPDIQRDCRDWRVRRGVAGLYWWLKHREGGAGLGGAASAQWPVLQGLLNARNQSLLGHGLQPVQQRGWQSLQDRVNNLVSRALRDAGCRQGAPPCQLPGAALTLLPDLQNVADLDP